VGVSGAPGTAGASVGGAGTAGSSNANGGAGGISIIGGSSGSAGSAGASGGSAGGGGTGSTAFKCPAGTFDAPTLGGTATRLAGAPPLDTFNDTGNNFTSTEGPVWIGDSLYFSELTGVPVPPSRILKIAPGNVITVAVPDSGSNGLAVDPNGNLIAAVHKDGSISMVALPSGTETPIASTFGMPPARFNSPNDLAIRSDGTIYFSDPNFQAPSGTNPQSAQRLYRIAPDATHTVTVATNTADTAYLQPNGVTLSPDEQTLYVSGSALMKFPVMADGTLGVSSVFASGNSGSDGMVVDCAGNLYVAGSFSANISVYSPTGTLLGMITAGGITTNVAFGGTDHKTLYITTQGTGTARGVYSIAMNVPGYPY
jgi:gluconolactonase